MMIIVIIKEVFMKEKIAIIGGGPAGILAAGIAGSHNKNITLFEKNERLGKKMFITGKGRCNITNASPIEVFFENIVSNKHFLYSSLYSFTNEDIMDLLSGLGLSMKVERGNRVFPSSNKSSDVVKTLTKFLNNNNVDIRLNSKISNIRKLSDKFIISVNNEDMTFNKLVLATGGKSYPATGSTGDGYIFAKELGHTITNLNPSLVPMEIYGDWHKDLRGLSLRNVELSARNNNKLIHKEFGEMIFTHYGISGPIVLSMSTYMHKNKNNMSLALDLKPALDMEKLDSRLIRDFDSYINKQVKNALFDLLPKKLIPWVIKQSKIDPEKPVNQVSINDRNALINSIKTFELQFKSFRPIEEAIITSGGVSTDEINPSTMESKIVPNLYFAGEIIDVDALTGGYNLQIAYSTGYLAGINI